MCLCALPEDADIVRGFVKVGGGSGLLSMIVPEANRSFTPYFIKLIHCFVPINKLEKDKATLNTFGFSFFHLSLLILQEQHKRGRILLLK